MSEHVQSIATDDEFEYVQGMEARAANIAAARGIAAAVESTLGPEGLDTMLVDDQGTVIVTNDGATILREVDVTHPAAQALVEVARTQTAEVGDGTTTAVLLASELLSVAEDLLERGVHPSLVLDGYQRAADRVVQELDEIARPVDSDEELLRHVAEVSLSGRSATKYADTLVPLVLEAVRAVTVDETVDLEYLDIRSYPGIAPSASTCHHGAVVDADPDVTSMPTDIPNARILLLHDDVNDTEPQLRATYHVESPEQQREFINREERWAADIVDHIAETGADVLFCKGHIAESVETGLAARGILAVEDLEQTDTDFAFLRECIGADAVMDPTRATAEHLGHADVTREHSSFYIENPETHGVTLVLRGSTEQAADEIKRNVRDATDIVTQSISRKRMLPGAGATEIELATRLRDHAPSIEGQVQLVVEAFADALEVIPRTLARNAGVNPMDALVTLRSAHADGETDAGLDTATGDTVDAFDAGVFQPAYVLEQSVYNAARVSAVILKIDGLIAADFEDDN